MEQKVFALDMERIQVKLLQQGCQKTFAKLYDDYAPALLGIIIRIVGNEKTSNEILQKTFLKIWEVKSSFDLYKGTFFTWMIKIARKISETEQEIYHIKNQQPGNSVYTSETGKLSAQNNTVKIHAISKDEEEALDLVYCKGYSFVEAASELNIDPDSLKAILKAAIGKLNGAVTV